MQTIPDISVIIPIYNVGLYLPRCLESVQRQTFKNIEIICINDGSTDNSAEILQQYAATDERIKIITQANKGLAAARNIGIENAGGKYIFFLDSDDYLHPQALDILYRAAKVNNAPIVVGESYCRLQRENPNTCVYNIKKLKPKLYKNPLKDLLRKRLVSAVTWNKLYKAEIIKNRRFIEGILYEDWPFTTCLFSDIDFFVGVKMPLYIYDNTTSSIIRSSWNIKKIKDYMTGIRYVSEYFSTTEKQKQWRLVQRRRISVSIKMVLSKISKSKENISELEKFFKQEYLNLRQNHIISFRQLTLKSKFRLMRLFWHQR
ncbi:MAG: glycosyltransferase family 2 protein [Alphaproteobacteria bacterium]|nr:glycosyltransferase family 2 protein [Alphaproteobacteria bacterium]